MGQNGKRKEGDCLGVTIQIIPLEFPRAAIIADLEPDTLAVAQRWFSAQRVEIKTPPSGA